VDFPAADGAEETNIRVMMLSSEPAAAENPLPID
jgi:hypothetical protein